MKDFQSRSQHCDNETFVCWRFGKITEPLIWKMKWHVLENIRKIKKGSKCAIWIIVNCHYSGRGKKFVQKTMVTMAGIYVVWWMMIQRFKLIQFDIQFIWKSFLISIKECGSLSFMLSWHSQNIDLFRLRWNTYTISPG